MECWVHQDTILNDEKANQKMREAWEQEDSKDELKIELEIDARSRKAVLVGNRSRTTRML